MSKNNLADEQNVNQNTSNERRDGLVQQIGVYTKKDLEDPKQEQQTQKILQGGGQDKLYEGLSEYQKTHAEAIAKYKAANPGNFVEAADDVFFRVQFVHFIEQKTAENRDAAWEEYKAKNKNATIEEFEQKRAETPEKFATTMNSFLKADGINLYNKALEEEANSKEYMNALLCKSTKTIEGPPLEKRPIIIVGGPSSSGKSTAVDLVLERASETLARKQIVGDDAPPNYAVIIDGGITRELSQIRKLAIHAANVQGYTGIKNIQDAAYKKPLDKAKQRVINTCYASSNLGMIIPETFANPLSRGNLLADIQKNFAAEDTQVIFARVDSFDEEMFAMAVDYLGERRAWEMEFDEDALADYDLNADVKESKPRDKNGYTFGRDGSRNVEKKFQSNIPGMISFMVHNDMIFVAPNQGSYEKVRKPSNETILISQGAFEDWQRLAQPREPIETYAKNEKIYCKQKPPPETGWDRVDSKEQGAVPIRIQTWCQWNNLPEKDRISLDDFANKKIWLVRDKNSWLETFANDPKAILVRAEVYEKWKNIPTDTNNSGVKEDLVAYNRRQTRLYSPGDRKSRELCTKCQAKVASLQQQIDNTSSDQLQEVQAAYFSLNSVLEVRNLRNQHTIGLLIKELDQIASEFNSKDSKTINSKLGKEFIKDLNEIRQELLNEQKLAPPVHEDLLLSMHEKLGAIAHYQAIKEDNKVTGAFYDAISVLNDHITKIEQKLGSEQSGKKNLIINIQLNALISKCKDPNYTEENMIKDLESITKFVAMQKQKLVSERPEMDTQHAMKDTMLSERKNRQEDALVENNKQQELATINVSNSINKH